VLEYSFNPLPVRIFKFPGPVFQINLAPSPSSCELRLASFATQLIRNCIVAYTKGRRKEGKGGVKEGQNHPGQSPVSRGEQKRVFKGAHGERRTRYAEGVEFEVPRVETPKASRGWGMGTGYPPPQPTRGFVGAS